MVTSVNERQPLLDKKSDSVHNADVNDSQAPPRYSFSSNDTPSSPPASAVNGLAVYARCRHEIAGSYELDPALPLTNTERRGGWHGYERPPTANFQARHGNISTKLSITGDATCRTHATIRATSRTGDILLDITKKSDGRNIDIETRTRRGMTVVLLPPNFAGVVELNGDHGCPHKLRGLDGKTALLRSSDQTLSFVVGAVSGDRKNARADYVRLSSKKGAIVVGCSGVDGDAQALAATVRKGLSDRRRQRAIAW